MPNWLNNYLLKYTNDFWYTTTKIFYWLVILALIVIISLILFISTLYTCSIVLTAFSVLWVLFLISMFVSWICQW